MTLDKVADQIDETALSEPCAVANELRSIAAELRFIASEMQHPFMASSALMVNAWAARLAPVERKEQLR